MDKYKSISRVEQPHKRQVGWLVRVKYQKAQFQKFFGDVTRDGRQGALQAAIEWRNKTEEGIGKPRSEQPVIGQSRTGNTEPGIRLAVKQNTLVYEATWPTLQGAIGRTAYSIEKHGEDLYRWEALVSVSSQLRFHPHFRQLVVTW